MSTAITFDTLRYSQKMIKAGFTQQQAEMQAEAMAEIVDEKLATKQDLKELELRMTVRFDSIMIGGLSVLVISSFGHYR